MVSLEAVQVYHRKGKNKTMDINFLPEAPGCYIFRDSVGDCLYVGKSKNLRSRVRSYFNKNTPPKVQKLAKLIASIEYRPATDEINALYLEHSLIKTYRPPFNSQMKKDRHPYYLCINWTYTKPGIYISDRPGPNALRYGSFNSVYDAKEALATISRAWRMPDCEARHFDTPNQLRSCLNLHIGRCIGPCNPAADTYREALLQAAQFMQGKNKQALQALKRDMAHAVQSLDFEKAAKLRDTISTLENLRQRFSYRIPLQGRRICVFIKGYHEPGFMLLYYKNGRLRQSAHIPTPECWPKIRDSFILGMTGKTEIDPQEHIYPSTATLEIRARKLYVDVTKTGKLNLPARLDRAMQKFSPPS